MTSIVIADRSFLSEIMRAARSALSPALIELFRGPVETILIEQTPTGKRRRSRKPIDVVVSPDIVLRRRIVVPAKARKDVAHAIDLFIRTETPFAPGDVLVHALEEPVRPSDQQVGYTVRLLPRATLLAGLETHGLRLRQVVRIGLHGMPEVDFADAMFPRRRLTRWLPAIPVLLALVGLGLLGLGELSQRQSQLAGLETEMGETLGRIRAITAEMDAARQQLSGTAAVRQQLAAAPSAFLTLEAIRQALPNHAEVLRVDLRGAEIRLAIRSPNALGDAQQLAGKGVDWSSSIEGPITADPTSNLEIATILLRPQPAGAVQ